MRWSCLCSAAGVLLNEVGWQWTEKLWDLRQYCEWLAMGFNTAGTIGKKRRSENCVPWKTRSQAARIGWVVGIVPNFPRERRILDSGFGSSISYYWVNLQSFPLETFEIFFLFLVLGDRRVYPTPSQYVLSFFYQPSSLSTRLFPTLSLSFSLCKTQNTLVAALPTIFSSTILLSKIWLWYFHQLFLFDSWRLSPRWSKFSTKSTTVTYILQSCFWYTVSKCFQNTFQTFAAFSLWLPSKHSVNYSAVDK